MKNKRGMKKTAKTKVISEIRVRTLGLNKTFLLCERKKYFIIRVEANFFYIDQNFLFLTSKRGVFS